MLAIFSNAKHYHLQFIDVYNAWGLRSSKSLPFLEPTNHQQPLKINELGRSVGISKANSQHNKKPPGQVWAGKGLSKQVNNFALPLFLKH